MSTNLRLSAEAAAALRSASVRTGRSQQELLREAVDRYLGLSGTEGSREKAVGAGLVQVPTPFQDVEPDVRPPAGQTTLELLGRDDGR